MNVGDAGHRERSDDRDLSDGFRAVRELRARRAAPSYQVLAGRAAAGARARRARRRRQALLVAGALPIALIVWTIVAQLRLAPAESEALRHAQLANEMLEWESPTDALLAADDLGRAGDMPPLDSSVIPLPPTGGAP